MRVVGSFIDAMLIWRTKGRLACRASCLIFTSCLICVSCLIFWTREERFLGECLLREGRVLEEYSSRTGRFLGECSKASILMLSIVYPK